jgi:hypothetical protein
MNKVFLLATVTVMFAVSCGEGNKKSDAEKEAQEIVQDAVEKAGIKETDTKNWQDNEYTKQLSKPKIDIKVAGVAEMGGN